MAYLTREDGERFIIPSYRDVLSAKKPTLLKKEITLLASSYGEYITMQKKGTQQYEVAFSPDPGYLLGESIWHYFKRPRDLIYCEEIPNTTDVILVIVKSGSVYLDGSFPADTIPEELIVFQTQQNNFEIYTYGDVPISETTEEGKFAFDASSVKSFKVLSSPVFPTLPTVKAFQLQLVDVVLKQQGIGIFPVKQLVFFVVIVGLGWMAWDYITTHKKEIPIVAPPPANPYRAYMIALTTPDPSDEIQIVSDQIKLLFSMPGWVAVRVNYANGITIADVKSLGVKTRNLFDWAQKNNVQVRLTDKGFNIILTSKVNNRQPPNIIAPLDQVIGKITDNLAMVYPGEHLKAGKFFKKDKYMQAEVDIEFSKVTPITLSLIGQQLRSLPVVLSSISINVTNTNLTGTIALNALGN